MLHAWNTQVFSKTRAKRPPIYKTRDRQHLQRAQLNIRVRDEQQVENTDGMTGHAWSNQKVRASRFVCAEAAASSSSVPKYNGEKRFHTAASQCRQVNRGLQHRSWGLRISRTSTNTTNEMCREHRLHGTLSRSCYRVLYTILSYRT